MSALDLAYDLSQGGEAPPTLVSPTADGGISFEWRRGSELVEIDVVGRGRFELTELHGQNVRRHEFLVREPESRKLELEKC
jgi:hypothetical protein